MKTRLLAIALAFYASLSAAKAVEVPVWTKLETWVVPEVAMENLSLGEAVAWVRAKSREIDPAGQERENAGVRIGFERRDQSEPKRLVTVKAEKIPLGDLLDEIGKQTKRSVQLFDEGVVLRRTTTPEGDDGMEVRNFWIAGAFNEAPDPALDPFDPDHPRHRRLVSDSAGAKAHLEEVGISFPEGSAVIYPATGRADSITIRNTSEQMELVDAYFAVLDGPGWRPQQCTIQVEVYAMTHASALALVQKAGECSNAVWLLRRIGEMRTTDGAELVALPMIVTRSGQRAKIESGWSRDLVTGYTVEDGKDRPTTKRATSGVVLEVDPVIGADGVTIEVNMALDLATGEPTVTQTEILAPVSGKPVTVEAVEGHAASLLTAITTLSGQPQLVGIIPAREGSDKALLVIVTATVISVSESFPVPE